MARAPPNERQVATAKYVASINLSSVDTFPYPLKTLPRPKGKATQVIYTTYDLPRRMPPRTTPRSTRKATSGIPISRRSSLASSIRVPEKRWSIRFRLTRTGPYAQGGLQIASIREGRVYFGNMSQMQIVRFDPKTEKMETFKAPVPDNKIGAGHLTMIDPSSQQVDGKIWINVADGTDEIGRDVARGPGERYLDANDVPAGQPFR